MSATQDFVALDWIKGEISSTLDQAQQALEAVAESPDDSSSMRACLTHLHQVNGTLRMVNLEGPAQLSAEMEELAQSLMGNEVPDVPRAQEVLMQAILQMPRYLDRIQREQRDAPEMVRPVVNNLRVARGEESLGPASGGASIEVDDEARLAPLVTAATPEAIEAYAAAGGAATVRKLRGRYQQALVALLKKQQPRENLALLGKVFTMLSRIAGDSPMGNLALLSLATVEGIGAGAIKLNGALASSLKQLDGELKTLIDAGDDGLSTPMSVELGGDLLAAVEEASKETPRIVAARARFAAIAAPESLDEDVSFGPDDETLSAVSRILIEELTGITDKLDLYVRSSNRRTESLVELVPQLEQINGTLSVVGLTQHMQSIAAQVATIKSLDGSGEAPGEDVLLDIARALLEVESSLKSVAGLDDEEGEGEDFASVSTAEATVIKETRNGLATCKDAVIEYVSNNFDQARVEDLPARLNSLRGGLLIISQNRSADVLTACSRYVQARIIEGSGTPSLSDMDDLADAITSVDYYLERYLESPGDPYLQMVEVAEQAIAKLGFPPGQAPTAPTAAAAPEAAAETPEAAAEIEEIDTAIEEGADTVPSIEPAGEPDVDVAEETAEEVAEEIESHDAVADVSLPEVEEPAEPEPQPVDERVAEAPEPVQAPAGEDEVDDEILEIFIEEAAEVLETINEYFPQWRSNTADADALTEVRRAYHTMKGSGRMVGATVVGELAWSVENMLNRVIEGGIEVTPGLLAVVEEVTGRLPEGVEAFRQGNQHAFECDDLRARADALAAGDTEPAASEGGMDDVAIDMDDEVAPAAEYEAPAAEQEAPAAEPEEVADFELEDTDDELEIESFEIEEEPDEIEAESQAPETAPDVDEATPGFEIEEIEFDEALAGSANEAAETVDADEVRADETSEPADGIELEDISLEEETADDVVDESDALEFDDIPAEADEESSFDLEDLEETAEAADLEAELESFAAEEGPSGEIVEEVEEENELDSIFVAEAGERLAVLRAWLETPGPASPEVVASFHTLKGSAGMAEVDSVSKVSAVMETLARRSFESGETPAGFADLVGRAATLIESVLADLASCRAEHPDQAALISEIEQLTSAQQATPVATFDFENIRLLSTAEDVLGAWDESQVSELVDELHEVTRQAESISSKSLGDMASALLGVYERLNERPTEDVATELARGHEFLVEMLDQVASSQAIDDSSEAAARLRALDVTPAPVSEEAVPAVGESEPVEPEPGPDLAQPAQPEVAAPAEARGAPLPADEIDEDVLPLFLEEAEELVEEIDQSVVEWSADPDATEHLDNLLRQLHTLKGGARMSGLASLGEYAHNFETYLIGIQSQGDAAVLDDAFFAVVNERQDEINRRVEIYGKVAAGTASDEEVESMRFDAAPKAGVAAASDGAPAPVADEVAVEAEVPVLTEAQMAPEEAAGVPAAGVPAAGVPATRVMEPSADEVTLPEDQVDEDVLPIFLEEAEEIVEEIDQSILDWSNEPDPTGHLDNLLRQLHTLKGGSRMAGLASLGEFTHNLETYLIGVQQRPPALNDDFFGGINAQQDEINRRLGIYKKLAAGDASDEDLASMRTATQPGTVAARKPAPADAAPASVPAEAAPAELQPDAAPAAAAKPAARQESKPAAQQAEMVRVSSDLLEELISLAGESSITRGRVEQQIADFGESLDEMEDTINRIREQVRRLEIEAESRETVYRTRARDSEDDSGFDDLEMDRYTMLQEISRALNEGMSDMLDLKDTLVDKSRDAETLLHQQARIGGDLQEGLTRTRMVPFARLIPRLRRIVRQISAEVGKSVRFDAYNVEGELDRTVLERIVAPLEHMLRNAVDHGIESAEKRAGAGKPEQGRIALRLDREGGYVVLRISDDGGGINVEAVKAKAIERGLMTADQQLSDHEIRQFIMHAGFSTAQKLTQISGRGVGMDVVVSEIKALGGDMEIDSTFGVGTEFTIRLPFTVSINRALMVVIQDEVFAIPLNTIEGIVRVSPYELEAYYQPDAPMFEYAGQPYRLSYMGKLLDKVGEPQLEGQVSPLPVILARSGDNAVALQVDRVIGSREVVVKSLGPQFNEVGGVSGATVLGDGSVVVILDVLALVRSAELHAADADAAVVEEPVVDAGVRTVMIVDDSVTVRKVTSRLMERQGWEVVTAKDGLDAVNQLQDMMPTIMLLDIEMPKMDGFEVLSAVRRDDRLQNLPIIMITSRTGEKHQQRALDLGVNRYLGKPFQEANLMSTIDEVLEETKG